MIFWDPFKPRLFYDPIMHCDSKIIRMFYTGDKFCVNDNMFLKMGTTRVRIILNLFLPILCNVHLCFLFLNEFPTYKVETISLLRLVNTKCVNGFWNYVSETDVIAITYIYTFPADMLKRKLPYISDAWLLKEGLKSK